MSVRLSDPAALDEMREALVRFRSHVLVALAEASGQMKRLQMQLGDERLPELRSRIPRLREQVVVSKTALMRKVMSAEALKITASTTDERIAVRRAEGTLEHHERLMKHTVAWNRRMQRNESLLRSALSPLGTVADRDLPNAIASLRAMALAIERYLTLAPTRLQEPESATGAEEIERMARTGVFADGFVPDAPEAAPASADPGVQAEPETRRPSDVGKNPG